MTEYLKRALQLIDKLRDENKINNREMGCLRRAILEERLKGKWIKNETRPNECQCTECGNYDLSYFPYCHWCGADMRVKHELSTS